VTKIKDGKRKTVTKKSPRKVCKTPDKPVVRQMRENLKLINRVLEEADIWLDITDEQMLKLREQLSRERDLYKRDVDFNRKTLHRVFLDRRLDLGGRFYGPWYQNIPKKYREYIRINDAPTLELDYSALHPNLLYALRDLDPPDPDPYRLNGYFEETHTSAKAQRSGETPPSAASFNLNTKVAGSIVVTSKSSVPIIAAGITPLLLTFIGFGQEPGLMSRGTSIIGGSGAILSNVKRAHKVKRTSPDIEPKIPFAQT